MKVVFIGNRLNVFKELVILEYKIEIFALKESILEKYLLSNKISYISFSQEDKIFVIDSIRKLNFDVLISNGCPFILPIINKNMFNIHPSYLPELRGKTPLNGVFYNELSHVGATMHRINEGVDAGNIIYQQKEKIDEDIDLGLVYFMSFYLEGVVFKKGWDLLKKNNFNFSGKKTDLEKGSYFNRTKDKMIVDFSTMNTKAILKTINAFGILSQGAIVKGIFGREVIRIFKAENVYNLYLNDLFKENNPGVIVLEYDSKFLVKTIDGLIKVVIYE